MVRQEEKRSVEQKPSRGKPQSNSDLRIQVLEPLGRSENSALPFGSTVLPDSLRAPSVPEGTISRRHKTESS